MHCSLFIISIFASLFFTSSTAADGGSGVGDWRTKSERDQYWYGNGGDAWDRACVRTGPLVGCGGGYVPDGADGKEEGGAGQWWHWWDSGVVRVQPNYKRVEPVPTLLARLWIRPVTMGLLVRYQALGPDRSHLFTYPSNWAFGSRLLARDRVTASQLFSTIWIFY